MKQYKIKLNIFYISLNIMSICISYGSYVYSIDDFDNMNKLLVPTKNSNGMQFPNLGSFEENFEDDCSATELKEDISNILIIGDAYGRLAYNVSKRTSTANILTNDISEDNLNSLIHLKKDTEDKLSIFNKQRMSGIIPIPGDCLKLSENSEFLKLFSDKNPNNKIDLLMISNVLNLLDIKQVLKLFIHTFNFLKPGGKAYIFDRFKIDIYSQLTENEIREENSTKYVYLKIVADTLKAARREKNILFPGYYKDKWFINKDKFFLKFV